MILGSTTAVLISKSVSWRFKILGVADIDSLSEAWTFYLFFVDRVNHTKMSASLIEDFDFGTQESMLTYYSTNRPILLQFLRVWRSQAEFRGIFGGVDPAAACENRRPLGLR